jgi:rhamnogalacturonyl hydrolase YesR
MKNNLLQSIVILSVVLLPSYFIRAAETELPSKSNIISTAQQINDYWIINHPDPGNNLWARSAYFAGNMELYKVFPKQAYLNYAVAWAEKNRWAISGSSSTTNADNHACGQVYIDLFLLDGAKDIAKIAGIKNAIDHRIANNVVSSDWWWVDALFMGMPTITRLGVVYNDAKYFDKLYALFHNTRDTLLVSPGWWTEELAEQYAEGPIVTCPDCGNAGDGLYNPADGLWWRDSRFQPDVPPFVRPKTTPAGNKIYWSRGNGWAIAALARTLQLLPADNTHRQEYIDVFIRMAEALKDCQREDGFWNMNLADNEQYAAAETSGTAFFAYGLAWGINNGLLAPDAYTPTAAKAWNALVTTAIMPNGNVKYVQNVGDCPTDPALLTTSSVDFGVGAVLLAASELSKLAFDDGLPPFDESLNADTLLRRADWTITTSSEGPVDDAAAVGGNNPRNMIDGDMNSAFLFVKPGKTYKGITVPEGVEPWFAIDLKKNCEMSYMRYRHRDYGGNTSANLRASKASFYGKNAETDEYQPIIENFNISIDDDEVRINFPAKVSYRYVKMVLKDWNHTAGSTIQVSEFNLGNTINHSGEAGISVAERSSATLYPNPAQAGQPFYISLYNEYPTVTVNTYNAVGAKFSERQYRNTRLIEQTIYRRGIYFAEITGNDNRQLFKIVVN